MTFLCKIRLCKDKCPSFYNSYVLCLSIIFCTVIIHRVVAHEDPPFRPNIPSMEMKPEYIQLMVDCWDDDPEERPHFYRIVERLKKISGRYIRPSRRLKPGGGEDLTKSYTGRPCPEVKTRLTLLYRYTLFDRKRFFLLPFSML